MPRAFSCRASMTREGDFIYLVDGLVFVGCSHDLVYSMLPLIISAPSGVREEQEGFDMSQTDCSIRLAGFG